MTIPEEVREAVRLVIERAYAPAVDAQAPYAKFMSNKAAGDSLALLQALPAADRLALAIAVGGTEFSRLLTTAKMLYANSLRCAELHHGLDVELNGLPGWLADCKADIEVFTASQTSNGLNL